MVAFNFSPASGPAARVLQRSAQAARSREAARHDAGLVARFNTGDESAFVEIVGRYHARMLQVALRLLHNHADAEEIAQDTFIRAHRGLANFRGDSSLAAWLYRIALNLARNRYWYFSRRCRHTTLSLDTAIGDHGTDTFADLVAGETPGPVHEAATNEFATIVTGCMARLPDRHREVLTLRTVQQHSYAHISRVLGIRVGTVKSRVARARKNLRQLLGESYPELGANESPFACFENTRASGRMAVASA